jgi:hypothetical protein
MSLFKEEHIEIILLAGSGSCCKAAEEFNKSHPLSTHIMHDTVAKLIEKFQKLVVLLTNQNVTIHTH